MIRESLEKAADRLLSAAGNSRLLGMLGQSDGEQEHVSARRGQWYRNVLHESESGVLFRRFRMARDGFFSASLRSGGLFLLLWGLTSAAVSRIRAPFDFWDPRFGIPLAVAVSGLPLCFSGRTVAQGLTDDFIAGNFLIGFCRFSLSLFEVVPRAERTFRTMFAGFAVGVLSAFLHPVWLPVALLGFSVLLLGLAVPEVTLIPMMLGFPFFGFLPHPSLLLGCFSLFSIVCWIPKALSGHRQYRFLKIDLAVLLFAAILLAGSAVTASGANGSGALFAVYLIAAWFPVRTWLTSPLWRRRAVGCLLVSGSVCAAVGVAQYLLGRGEVRWLDVSRFGDLGGRVSSTFGNPNVLAVFLLVIFSLSLGALFTAVRGHWFALVPLFLSGICLIFTWSRGAWLGAIAATGFFLLLQGRGTLAALMVSPLAVMEILPWLPNGIKSRFGSIGNLAESSSRYRVNTWKGVLRMIRAYPFGIGGGETAFHTIFPKFAVSGTESVMHAHNVFLQVAAEYGVAAGVLLLTILWLLFRRFFTTRFANSTDIDRASTLGGMSAVVSLSVMGTFDHLWYQPTLFYLVWFVAALTVAQSEAAGEENFYGA